MKLKTEQGGKKEKGRNGDYGAFYKGKIDS